jgi:hypothetical protein
VKSLAELAGRWRNDAALLARYGCDEMAKICRLHADELDAAAQAGGDEALSLREAARESGYSTERLRHMVAEGSIKNAGRKGSPAIRRADLPRKVKKDGGGFDASAAAQRILTAGSHGRSSRTRRLPCP